jgi:hypothetical protein
MYSSDYNQEEKNINLYDLTVIEHNEDFEDPSPVIDIQNKDYKKIIESLSSQVNERFNSGNGVVDRGLGHFIDDIWHFEESLVKLGNYIVPTLEKNIFGSHVHVDNIKIYRNIITNKPDTSSWLWHFDNSPKEQIKILIYLTDVDSGCGEFTFLHNGSAGVKVPTSRISWNEWKDPWNSPPPFYSASPAKTTWYGTDRIPNKVVQELLNSGYQKREATGKAGTLFIFDNNIIHKASTAKNKHRDVIVFQFKPSMEKIIPYINRDNTGSGHLHTTFNVDPSILEALPATEKNNIINQLKQIKNLKR